MFALGSPVDSHGKPWSTTAAYVAAQLRAGKNVRHAASGLSVDRLCVGIVVAAPGRVAAICSTIDEAARVAASWVKP